jgi:uncharacterized phiE125 gp8 family phage protein
MRTTRITPILPAISYEDAKRQLNLDPDDNSQQDLIMDFALAATQEVELYTAVTMMESQFEVALTHFQSRVVVPVFPVQEVVRVEYYDENGDLQILPQSEYQVDIHGGECVVRFNGDKPATDLEQSFPVDVIVKAGYDSLANVPAIARRSILMKITSYYEKREDHYAPGQMKSSDLLLVPICRNFPS